MSNNENKTKPKTWQLVQDIKNMELEIDARKQIERLLKSREDRFKTIFFHAPVAYFLIDVNGNFIDGNLASYQLTGFSTEELFGKNITEMDLVDKKDQKPIMELIFRSGKGEYTGPDEFSIKKKDGIFSMIEVMTSPVTINNQKLTLCSAHDITNRKLMQTKLQVSEERFRKLFESTHDALMTLNPPTWKFTSGNPAILKMFNVKNIKEFLTYGPWDVSPNKQPDGRLSSDKAKEMIEMAMTKGSNFFEWTHKRISGQPFPATVLLTKIQLKDETFLQATVRDITEQKKADDVNEVLFDISNAVNTTRDLKDLYNYIHRSLGKIINVINFYIALVDTKNKTIYFPYHVDTIDDGSAWDSISNFDSSDSLTGLVVSKRKSILLKKEDLDKLGDQGGLWGPQPLIWMGVPLIINNEVIGVVAAQSYVDPNLYTMQDLKILTAVSEQVAFAIERKKVNQELKQSEERFKRLFNDLGDAVFVTKLGGANRGQILEVNLAAELQTGYSRDELLKMNIINDIYVSGSGELKADNWEERLAEGEIVKTIEKKKKKNGKEYWSEVIVSPVLYMGKNAGLSISHDITELKLKEKDINRNVFQRGKLLNIARELSSSLDLQYILNKITDQMLELLESKGATIYLIDSDKQFLMPVATRDPGYEEEVMSQKVNVNSSLGGQVVKGKEGMVFNFASLNPDAYQIPGTSADNDEHLMILPLLDKKEIFGTLNVYRKEKIFTEEDMELAETFALYASTAIQNAQANMNLVREINERKRGKKALQESESILKSILDSTGDGLLVVNSKGKVTHRNDEFNKMWRIPSNLIKSKDDNKLIDFVLNQLTNPNQFTTKVAELYNSTKSDRDILHFIDGRIFERYTQSLTRKNIIAGRIWSFRDITDRMQAVKALKKNEEKYHSLTENLQIGIYRNTPGAKGKFIEVNKAMIEMFGFKDRESMLSVPTSSLYVSPQTRKLFSDKLQKKGSIKNEELRLLRKDGNTFIGSVTAISVKDEDGRIIHYDGIIEDITERVELRMKLQENEEKFRSIVHNSPCIIMQADRHGIISFINYKYSGQEPANIIGKSIYDLIPLEYHEAAKTTINKVFGTGDSYSFESLGLATDESAVWYKNTVSSIRKNDKVVGIAILAADISEQKQTDIMKTEFISSVSHELRTPLTIIRESLSLLSDGLFGKLNKDQADIVNPAMEEVDRLGRIINNLLDISKIDEQKIIIERETVDIIKLARGVVKSFKNQVTSKNIELVLTSNQESMNLYLDRDRIIQVFMNLIGNATKFTKEGKIEVIITDKKNTVECCIADTGKGINTTDLGTVFDRFHQVGKVVKAGEKGAGLGLSISKGIVKMHHGKIWVNSKLDKGSKFYFSLPKYNSDEIILENIDKGLDVASKEHIKLSLLLVRVDNLSEIDKIYKNGKGSKIINDILRAFQDTLAPGEFSFINNRNEIVLFSDITAQNISFIGSTLEEMLEKSLAKAGIETNVELSFGYSIYPSDADNASDLIEAANKNMKKQKS